jgi:hypothetical protein
MRKIASAVVAIGLVVAAGGCTNSTDDTPGEEQNAAVSEDAMAEEAPATADAMASEDAMAADAMGAEAPAADAPAQEDEGDPIAE